MSLIFIFNMHQTAHHPISFFRFCRSKDENLLYIFPRVCYNKLCMHIFAKFHFAEVLF